MGRLLSAKEQARSYSWGFLYPQAAGAPSPCQNSGPGHESDLFAFCREMSPQVDVGRPTLGFRLAGLLRAVGCLQVSILSQARLGRVVALSFLVEVLNLVEV